MAPVSAHMIDEVVKAGYAFTSSCLVTGYGTSGAAFTATSQDFFVRLVSGVAVEPFAISVGLVGWSPLDIGIELIRSDRILSIFKMKLKMCQLQSSSFKMFVIYGIQTKKVEVFSVFLFQAFYTNKPDLEEKFKNVKYRWIWTSHSHGKAV